MNILTSWKTSLAGVLVIVVSLLNILFGIKVPGFQMDIGSSLMVGLGLLVAKDGNVTGDTVKQ